MSGEKKGATFCSYEQGMFPEVLRRSFGDGPLDALHEQEATAIHEAGHAVAAWLLGIEYESIEMTMHKVDGAVAWGGECVPHEDRRILKLPDHYGPIYRVHGIITLSGPAAERKYRLFHHLPMHKGNDGDHDKFDTHMAKHLEGNGRRRDAFRRLIWRRAQTIMEAEQVWNAVSLLALHLTGLLDEAVDWTDEAQPTITVSVPWSDVTDAVHLSGLENVAIENIFPRTARVAAMRSRRIGQ